MSIELVMLSNHLILCCPLLLQPSIFPSIRVFSNESVLRIRWPKYWSLSFSISPSNEYSKLISIRIDWFDHLAVQGTLKGFLQHHNLKAYTILSRVCEYKQYPSSSNVQSAREIRQAQKWWYHGVDCAVGEWFSKRGPQTSSMSITWELVGNPHSHPALNILNQKPWWWGPAIRVLTRHAGF